MRIRDILFPENTKIRKKIRQINIIFKEITKINNIKKFFITLKEDKANTFYYIKRYLIAKVNPQIDLKYEQWIKENEFFENIIKNEKSELLTIIIKVNDNTYVKYFKRFLDSLSNQIDSNYKLLIINDCKQKGKIIEKICIDKEKIINLNFNNNFNIKNIKKYIEGEYIAFLKENVILSKQCIHEINSLIQKKLNVDFIYSDNDEITFLNSRINPFFKPDFSPDTLRSFNYIGEFFIVRKQILFNIEKIDFSNFYDIIFNCIERSQVIKHISKILYSTYNLEKIDDFTNIKAIKNHIKRIGMNGIVKYGYSPNTYKIEYSLINKPKITIIIPNKDEIEILQKCINSILEKTTYDNYEIIVIENNSEDKNIFDYYEKLKENNKIKILEYKEKGFNYSKIINYGVKKSYGEYIIQLNNDTEIITPNWIEQMLSLAQREDVGAVGVKLLYFDETVQHAGTILGLGGIAGHACVNLKRNQNGYFFRNATIQNVSAVTGACLMCKKSMYEEIGFMNEELCVAFNDVDFCMKIRKKNKLIIFTPFVELFHYESKSRGNEDTLEKIERFEKEVNLFEKIWNSELIKGDPYYNKNLDLSNDKQYQLKLN